jgi:hypothetical protein
VLVGLHAPEQTVGIVFVRHEGEIRSIETDRLLPHPAHPRNTLAQVAGLMEMPVGFMNICKGEVNGCTCSYGQAQYLVLIINLRESNVRRSDLQKQKVNLVPEAAHVTK